MKFEKVKSVEVLKFLVYIHWYWWSDQNYFCILTTTTTTTITKKQARPPILKCSYRCASRYIKTIALPIHRDGHRRFDWRFSLDVDFASTRHSHHDTHFIVHCLWIWRMAGFYHSRYSNKLKLFVVFVIVCVFVVVFVGVVVACCCRFS